MLPKTHLALTLFLAAALMLAKQITLLPALLIVFGGFLIDTDHYLWYVWNKKDWSLKRAYKWHYSLYLKKTKIKFLHVFHTFESFIVILLLTNLWSPLIYLFYGMLFHISLDGIQAIERRYYGKKISLIYEVLKRKK